MAQEIQDHRASLKTEPRSIYGKIVSSADRRTDIEDGLRVVYQYNLKYNPHFTLDENIDASRNFIPTKYGASGYANGKSYFHDPEFHAYSHGLVELTKDPTEFRRRFLAANNITTDTAGDY